MFSAIFMFVLSLFGGAPLDTLVQVADSVAATVQQTSDQWYIALVKLSVFSVCVTASVEVFKHFVGSIVPPPVYKNIMTEDRLRLLNFAVAFFLCFSIDYGILSRVVEVGIRAQARESLGRMVDYYVTASICTMGARWAFEKFSTSLSSMKAVRDGANGTKKMVETTKVEESSKTTEVKSA